MAGIFLKIINMSISASWLVLAVLIARLLLKKAPKWINGILWGIVGLRLVMPFSLESIFSLIPSAETISKAPNASRPHFESGITIVDNQVNDYLQGHYFEGVTRPTGHFVDITTISAIIWIVGIVALLVYTMISYLRVKNKIGTAVLLRDNIFQSENVVSPFVLGVIKPKVYLPFHMNEQDMEHVIAHEQAHIRRKDHWWKPLGFLVLILHWFNPFMWLGYVLLCRDIELACDEKVVKDFSSEQKADYSQALLTCSVNRRMIAACPLAFGEVGVKERVKSVLNYKKPAFWMIVVAIVVSVAVAVCFLTNPVSNRLENIENLTLNSITEETVEVWVSDGVTYHSVGAVSKNLLQDLCDIKISQKEISLNREEERDKSHTLVLQTKQDTEPSFQAYLTGLYIHFNNDFSSVWVNTGVKPTLSYKVINPQKAKEIYVYIEKYNASESADIAQLKAKFPMYFDLDTTKGLEVFIWQMAGNAYSCGLLPGKNLGYTQEEIWELHRSTATLDEMKAIVATYLASGKLTKSEVVIHPIQMPHSSYAYHIDDEYCEKISNLFGSEFPIIQEISHSSVIDSATFDIDRDGKEEQCTLSYGPTSGLFTFIFSASENGELEYFNIFKSPFLTLCFEQNAEGQTRLIGKDGAYTRHLGIDVYNGNIRIFSDEQDISYWGEQGVNSPYAPKS